MVRKGIQCTAREANGKDLSYEADNSCDYIQSVGVFVYISFINQCKYFKEMARVLKPGGYLVLILCRKAYLQRRTKQMVNFRSYFSGFYFRKVHRIFFE
ncbi:MAG: class I SAM-dependent methyltransferase [Sphingobacteriaceae bacterium]|nr:class I SAM-dependent methyltransferase [Sphingobacteriaceae bacterium]